MSSYLKNHTSVVSLEFRVFFSSAMLCVILILVPFMFSFCLVKAVRCLKFISSRSNSSFMIMLSIFLCKSSPCFSIAVVNFWEFLLMSAFWTWMRDAASLYLGWIDFLSFCQSLFKMSFFVSKLLKVVSTCSCPKCSPDETQI